MHIFFKILYYKFIIFKLNITQCNYYPIYIYIYIYIPNDYNIINDAYKHICFQKKSCLILLISRVY